MSLIDARRLFQRSLSAAPVRLHFAAHSHHLWPDASYVGQIAAWDDAARLADRKWDRVMGELWPAAQHHVAHELGLSDPSTIVFGSNTHELIVRLASHLPRPLRLAFGLVLPVSFVGYLPALVLLDLPGPPLLPAWLAWFLPLAAVWTWALALLVWRAGVRHYQGGGG